MADKVEELLSLVESPRRVVEVQSVVVCTRMPVHVADELGRAALRMGLTRSTFLRDLLEVGRDVFASRLGVDRWRELTGLDPDEEVWREMVQDDEDEEEHEVVIASGFDVRGGAPR
jgi:hypothetical protein